jgi:hypothetical protein
MTGAEASVRSSDVLMCGLKLTYLEFGLSCIAIAADLVKKDEPLLTKVWQLPETHPSHASS